MDISFEEYVSNSIQRTLDCIAPAERIVFSRDDLLLAMVRANKGFVKIRKELNLQYEESGKDTERLINQITRIIVEILKGPYPEQYKEYLALYPTIEHLLPAYERNDPMVCCYLLVLNAIIEPDVPEIPTHTIIRVVNDMLQLPANIAKYIPSDSMKSGIQPRVNIPTDSMKFVIPAYDQLYDLLDRLVKRDKTAITLLRDNPHLRATSRNDLVMNGCIHHNLPGTFLSYCDRLDKPLSQEDGSRYLCLLLNKHDLDDAWEYVLAKFIDQHLVDICVASCVNNARVGALQCFAKARAHISTDGIKNNLRVLLMNKSDCVIAVVDALAELILNDEKTFNDERNQLLVLLEDAIPRNDQMGRRVNLHQRIAQRYQKRALL